MPSLLRVAALVAALVPVLTTPAVAAADAAFPPGPGTYLEQRLGWGPCTGFARTDGDRVAFAGARC